MLAGAAAALTVGCGKNDGPARSQPTGRIAFVSDRDGNDDIYVMNADGSGLRNLTNDPPRDYSPAWSPDGTKLAFVSDRDGNDEIYVMKADGSGATRLSNTPERRTSDPAWSPDGTKLAFVRYDPVEDDEDSDNPDIYVINADGSGLRNLTRHPDADLHPAWSPDGTRLAFVCGDRICTIKADGSGARRLTNRPRDDHPVWSPDGAKLALVRGRGSAEVEDSGIYVINADGSGAIRLTNSSRDDLPVWSPDGTKLALVRYDSPEDDNPAIYVMNADGSGLRKLTSHDARVLAWSPDGTMLAFDSESDGNLEIYVANADGSGVTRLTNHAARDQNPRWSPASQEPPAPAPAASAAAPAPAGPVPTGPLQPEDFVVAGVTDEADSAGIVAALGRPDSIEVRAHPWDSAGLRVWHYRGRGIEVGLTRSIEGVTLTAPATATARGVRVGYQGQRVRAAYGEPQGGTAQSWRYDDDSDPSGLHGIEVRIHGDRVASIHLGQMGYDNAPPPWEWARPPWVVSGEGLGPITRRTSEQDLIRLLGSRNVRRDSILLATGESELGTILFATDPLRRVEIRWTEWEPAPQAPSRISIGGRSVWRTSEGVTIGTRLQYLERLNGRTFTFSGWGWELGGRVCSWEGGRLDSLLRNVHLRLIPLRHADTSVFGEECRSSSHLTMRGVAPVVGHMEVVFRP